MIDTVVCAAPAGIAGSARVRVPVLPQASHLIADAHVGGGAMRRDARGTAQPVLAPRGATALGASPLGAFPLGTSTQAVGGTTTPFGTTPFGTDAYTTLGIRSPGRPLS